MKIVGFAESVTLLERFDNDHCFIKKKLFIVFN